MRERRSRMDKIISYSELTQYLACPYDWYWTHHGYKRPRPYKFTFGAATHEAIAYLYQYRKDNQAKPEEKQFKEAFEVANDVMILDLEVEPKQMREQDALAYIEEAKGYSIDQCIKLIQAYMDNTDYLPAEIECMHEMTIDTEPNGDRLILRGKWDMTTTDHKLVEIKTSSKKPSMENGIAPKNQGINYSLLFNDKYGFLPEEIHRNTLVKYKTDKDPFFQLRMRQEELAPYSSAYIKTLKRVADEMKREVYLPDESDLHHCTLCDAKHVYCNV